MTKSINCPRCGKQNTWKSENLYRPFCSERCKLIDLGAWADEKYRVPDQEIPSQPINDETDEK